MDGARRTRNRVPVEWVPQQFTQPSIHDYRYAAMGPKGYKEKGKRTLEDMEALHQADLDQAASRMEDEGHQPMEITEQPASKRIKVDGVAYMPASGKAWKVPAQRAADIMKVKVNPTWEKKEAARASRAHFLEHKKAAVEAAKAKRKAMALQRKAAAERKLLNRGKSEVVQKITSNVTLKKMMKNKKQKKTLRKADTN